MIPELPDDIGSSDSRRALKFGVSLTHAAAGEDGNGGHNNSVQNSLPSPLFEPKKYFPRN